MSCDICNHGNQFGRFKRLGHMRLEPRRKGSTPIVRACVAGQRDRRKKTPVLRLVVANPSDERVPVLAWEADIADQHVGPLPQAARALLESTPPPSRSRPPA
jgi:hypothetical protein